MNWYLLFVVVLIGLVVLWLYFAIIALTQRLHTLEKFNTELDGKLVPIYIADRPPTELDFNGLKIGSTWIDKEHKRAYFLAKVHADWIESTSC